MQLNLYRNPEDDIDDATLSKLVETAQDAFDRDGLPTPDDVENHIVPASTFITLEDDGEILGFSATDLIPADGDIIYAAGLAVRQDRQGEGLGKLLRLRGIQEELEDSSQPVATRTQNPVVMNYFIQYFDAHPRDDSETPPEIKQLAADVAEQLDGSAEFDFPVMREAYPGSMYDELPDSRYRDHLLRELDYCQWRCRHTGRVSRQGRAG